MDLCLQHRGLKAEFTTASGDALFELEFTSELEYWSFSEAYSEAMVKFSARKAELHAVMSKMLALVPKVAQA